MGRKRNRRREAGPVFPPVHVTLWAENMQPLRQGDLDGLCGLYAAVNALCLVLAPAGLLRQKEKKTLFRTGIDFLDSTSRLDEFINDGIDPEIWFRLIDCLVDAAATAANCRIHVFRPLKPKGRATRPRLFKAIKEAIDHGLPVLISLSGAHDHYTVVCGYSPFSIWLYDSGDLQRLACDSIGVEAGRSARHGINPQMLTVVEVVTGPEAADG